MTAESDVVLAVSRRLLEANGEHPESVHVKEELARMFLESQKIVQELGATVARHGVTRP